MFALALFVRGADAVALAPAPVEADFDRSFKGMVQPFVENYCVTCHSGDKPAAGLDFAAYPSLDSVVGDIRRWNLIGARIKSAEMPPKDSETLPGPEERKSIIAWITALNAAEAKRHAGDPGSVLARRLSNAEYDYTIHDLTGVDLHPTKEFPVDPANEAGFDNTGESLAMSPALFKKYYQAAQDVADHLVLEPDGFTFGPYPMLDESDRDKYSVLRIVDFYQRQPTDFAEYFLAAWRFAHRAELGEPQATLAEIAAESKISPKYLATVWAALQDASVSVGPLATVQASWRAWPAPAQTNPAFIRANAVALRDFVVNLRDKIVPEVPNLSAPGIGPGSQPMVLWKDRQMAANRRRYDSSILQEGTRADGNDLVLVTANLVDGAATAPTRPLSAPTAAATTDNPVAKVNPTPAMNARLPSGLGLPAAPVATAGADGHPLSAVEIADLALAAQPARRAGGPLPKTPDIVKFGGVFLEATVTTTGTSATARMANAKLHAHDPDPNLVVPADPAERARYEAAFAHFADVFPDAFYISERARVYLDPTVEESLEGRLLSAGLHSQTGYFRDDGPLYDLILDDAGRKELDHLWEVFNYSAAIPARMHTSFLFAERDALQGAQFDQYRPENQAVTTQPMIKSLTELILARVAAGKATDVAVAAVKDHFARVAADNLWLDQTREAAVPSHLQALQDFAQRAYRRPLTARERDDLVAFYHASRTDNGVDHEDAMRDCIVRVLMSPYFLYQLDLSDVPGAPGQVSGDNGTGSVPKVIPAAMKAADKSAGAGQAPAVGTSFYWAGARPLGDYELASRLSYFLWSSLPDAELLQHAAAGDLHRPEVLLAQTHRMLQDDHIRNFATEFGGNWLDFRRFQELNTVDRERFPTFTNDLREAMFQEPIHFIVDLVRADRSVLNFLDADYTFVNPLLAKHYGMPTVTGTNDTWVRVDKAGAYSRGGLLPMAAFLTANSPGLRTSPVKRGNWVVRRLLGERIPAPPPNVPALPPDEAQMGGLSLRQMLAKHREDPNCASCHARFDSFGLVFEGFGPVGESRTLDLGGRPVDASATFPGGSERTGLAGLRSYIHENREGDFLDNLCRKLLSYGLGRTLMPSDEPLVDEMRAKLAANDNRFSAMMDVIVASPQFRSKRASVTLASAAKTAMGN